MFGKIVVINKNDIDKIISGEEDNLDLKIFSKGHRNPQGLTRINDSFFSVEHGPLGGDELNKLIKDKNYGWPVVSYGTHYLYDGDGKSFEIENFYISQGWDRIFNPLVKDLEEIGIKKTEIEQLIKNKITSIV